MILLVFVASILVSVLLERQGRQHRLERAIEYERLGIPVPSPRPKLKRTEAWLNVGLGFLLVGLSFISAWVGFMMKDLDESFPNLAAHAQGDFMLMIENGAFYLAGGIALAWLGWKAVRENTRYESGAAGVSAPGPIREASKDTPPIGRSK